MITTFKLQFVQKTSWIRIYLGDRLAFAFSTLCRVARFAWVARTRLILANVKTSADRSERLYKPGINVALKALVEVQQGTREEENDFANTRNENEGVWIHVGETKGLNKNECE